MYQAARWAPGWSTLQPHPWVPPHSTPPVPCCPLLTSLISAAFCFLHLLCAPISLQFPPRSLGGRALSWRPCSLGLPQPSQCLLFLLFSFPCNLRDRWDASKHCNHILNGNEMCELNVNYSRMEGQSLVKVWHLVLQTFPKRHNCSLTCDEVVITWQLLLQWAMLVTGSFV